MRVRVTFEDIYEQGHYISQVMRKDLEKQIEAYKECDEEKTPSKRELARRRKLIKAIREVIDYYSVPEDFENWIVVREEILKDRF